MLLWALEELLPCLPSLHLKTLQCPACTQLWLVHALAQAAYEQQQGAYDPRYANYAQHQQQVQQQQQPAYQPVQRFGGQQQQGRATMEAGSASFGAQTGHYGVPQQQVQQPAAPQRVRIVAQPGWLEFSVFLWPCNKSSALKSAVPCPIHLRCASCVLWALKTS